MKFIVYVVTLGLISGCSLGVYKSVPSDVSGNSYFGKSYNLPTGRISITLARKDKDTGIQATVSSKIVADQNTTLFLEYHRNYLFEDVLVAETDASGLLASINTTTTDKTAAIFEQVGALAGEAMKLGALDAELGSTAKGCNPKDGGGVFTETFEFDPYMPIDDINRQLHIKHCIELDLSGIPKKNIVSNIPSDSEARNAVFFRDLKEFSIQIKHFSSEADLPDYRNSFYVSLPDLSRLNKISIERGLFVERKVNLTFSSGTLTTIDAKYPSEVLGFVSLPLAVVKGVSGAILGQFGLKIDTLKNQTSLATEELNLLKAKAALQKGN